jgi:CRISPR system Cascade subunit CasC
MPPTARARHHRLELHILQNVAPSCLNRDDTQSPKDAHFGGVRRARVSSQAWKHAMRELFAAELLQPEELAARTKHLVHATAELVTAPPGVDRDRVKAAVARALGGARLKADPEQALRTEYLLFLPKRTIGKLAALVTEHLDALLPPETEGTKPEAEPGPEGDSEPKRPANKAAGKVARRAEKAANKAAVPSELQGAIDAILADNAGTPEVALFGAMQADAAPRNVKGAAYTAHIISTHAAEFEIDYYTAGDDLAPADATGAAHVATSGFTSACFYRCLFVDLDQLRHNLGGDAEARAQAKRTIGAFVRAAVLAMPSGKQHSMAAQNPPSFVLADVRSGAPRQLSNAFVKPVTPERTENGDLLAKSILRLGREVADLDRIYGVEDRRMLDYFLVDPEATIGPAFAGILPGAIRRESLDAFVARAAEACFPGEAAS